jgi:hypothetical protein
LENVWRTFGERLENVWRTFGERLEKAGLWHLFQEPEVKRLEKLEKAFWTLNGSEATQNRKKIMGPIALDLLFPFSNFSKPLQNHIPVQNR